MNPLRYYLTEGQKFWLSCNKILWTELPPKQERQTRNEQLNHQSHHQDCPLPVLGNKGSGNKMHISRHKSINLVEERIPKAVQSKEITQLQTGIQKQTI